jgi:hypothetical protein
MKLFYHNSATMSTAHMEKEWKRRERMGWARKDSWVGEMEGGWEIDWR